MLLVEQVRVFEVIGEFESVYEIDKVEEATEVSLRVWHSIVALFTSSKESHTLIFVLPEV